MSIIRCNLDRQRRLLIFAIPVPPPPPTNVRSSVALHRSPFLFLAAMMMALAVLFAPGGQPALAQQSFWSATLTVNNAGGCNHITGSNSCANRLTDTDFTYGGASYTIRFIRLDTGTLFIDFNKAAPDSLKNSGVALVVGDTSLAFTDATRSAGVGGNRSRLTWTSTGLSWTAGGTVSLSLTDSITMTAEFADGITIADKEYTVGADVNESYTDAHDQGLPRLPEVTVEFGVEAGDGQYKVAYILEDLPAGLSMGSDRVIRGVPESATSGAVTVTYTAAVTFYTAVEDPQEGEATVEEAGTASASLTFTITVTAAAPPVIFDAEAQKFFAARTVAWVPGTGWRNNVLPEAQGGTGTITYSLINNDTGAPLADGSPITFNAATRTIGGTPWEGTSYAVTYIATDENGATAQGYIQVRHGVGGL